MDFKARIAKDRQDLEIATIEAIAAYRTQTGRMPTYILAADSFVVRLMKEGNRLRQDSGMHARWGHWTKLEYMGLEVIYLPIADSDSYVVGDFFTTRNFFLSQK